MKKNMLGLLLGTLLTVCAAGSVLAGSVTIEDAKKKALEAVGIDEKDVVFGDCHEGTDDGRAICEVEFFIPGELKYDFEIDAETGMILDEDMDLWEAEDDLELKQFMESQNAAEPSADKEGFSLLQAKAIVLKDAGLKDIDGTFIKEKKDLDDGIEKYEIEFRTSDGVEYEYEIDAVTGKILEKDVERD